jgi:response regulator RpfG family c-di-GMP phosphodiesterase/DNA-binding CsgD family transcriptional regulator
LIEKIMENSIYKEIQFPIDITAQHLDIEMQLLTSEGSPLLKQTHIRRFYDVLTEGQKLELRERFFRIIQLTPKDSFTSFYDVYPGLKIAITPLPLKEPLFLISGYFLSISDSIFLRTSLEHELGRKLDDIEFESFPKLDEVKRDQITAELNRLQKYLLHFMDYVRYSDISKKYCKILTKLRSVFSELIPFETKFSKAASLLQALSPFSVMGLAIPLSKNKYKVNYVYGNYGVKWMDYEFDAGEGFFGWVALMQNPGKWDDVTQDPRYYSIRQVCDTLKSLSLFPLVHGKENLGVLFFASEEAGLFTEDWMSFIQGIESNFKHELLLESYEAKMEYMSKKITILMGISQLLTTNIEPKRILNIVVDFLMSIEGVDHSFGVILNDTKDQVQWLVGRGMSIDEIKSYCNDFLERQVNEFITDQQIAFPIQMNGQTKGWFYIGSKEKINRKDVIFTNTMVSVAGTVLTSCVSESRANYSPVDIVLPLIQFKDRQIYEHTQRVKGWVEMICSQLNVDDETRSLTVKAAEIHEIGILVMTETNVKKLHSGNLDEHYNAGVRVLEILPPLQYLAPIIRNRHEFYNGNGPLGLKNGEIPLPARILHVADEFDTLVAQTDSSPDRIFKIISEMEQQKGKQYDPEVMEAFIHVMRRRFSVEVSNINLIERKLDINSNLNTLSPRELEVISCMAKGLSNKEIASRLYISEHTVKNHISNIFQKLNLSDRTSVVSLAYQKGLIQ